MGLEGLCSGAGRALTTCRCGHMSHYHNRSIPLPKEPPEHYTDYQKHLHEIDKRIGYVLTFQACALCECSQLSSLIFKSKVKRYINLQDNEL